MRNSQLLVIQNRQKQTLTSTQLEGINFLNMAVMYEVPTSHNSHVMKETRRHLRKQRVQYKYT